MSPLLMWVFPIPFLIPIVMSAEVFGGILLSRQWVVHADDRSRLLRMLAFSALCLPIGIFISGYVPPIILKAFTSFVVIIFAAYLLLKPHYQLILSKPLDGLAGGLSGFLLGSCGIGGPPAALYLNAANQPFERTRSLLSTFVSGISLFAIAASSLMGGGIDWLSYLLLAIPAYWAGMGFAGHLLRRHAIPDGSIRRLCLMLLIGNSGLNLLLLVTR